MLKSFKIAVISGIAGLAMAGCQFQPLYGPTSSLSSDQSGGLMQIAVAEVDSRVGQQVRNHLIFLLSGGSTPVEASREVRLRISSTTANLASKIQDLDTNQRGNTAGQARITASYEIYDRAARKIIARGSRTAYASFDQTSQSYASERAKRDAENRAAIALAEQLRLAIASDIGTP